MTFNSAKLLDDAGWKILMALQADARLSWTEIGRQVGLTTPAVAKRVRKLEEAEQIEGYHARVDPGRPGTRVLAFIRLSTPAERYPRVLALAATEHRILECHHVSGAEAFFLKVSVANLAELEKLIGQLGTLGQTTTSIVLSSPVARPDLAVEALRQERAP